MCCVFVVAVLFCGVVSVAFFLLPELCRVSLGCLVLVCCVVLCSVEMRSVLLLLHFLLCCIFAVVVALCSYVLLCCVVYCVWLGVFCVVATRRLEMG